MNYYYKNDNAYNHKGHCYPNYDPYWCWNMGQTLQAGISYQLDNVRALEISNGYILNFNTFKNKINNFIEYNGNGKFTFKLPGHYYINFWVNVVSSTIASDCSFVFSGTVTPEVAAIEPNSASGSQSSMSTGQSIIDVKENDTAEVVFRAPAGDIVLLGDSPVQAFITIFYLGPQQ